MTNGGTGNDTNMGKSSSPFKNFAFFNNFQNSDQKTYRLESYQNQNNGWGTAYNDPTLNNLVEKLLTQNIDLKIAAERLLQAQEQINISQSGLYPTISASTSASRVASPNNFDGIGAFQPAGKTYNNNFDLGLDAAWQLDLFGEIRNQTKSSQATYLASVANRDAIVQSIIAQLINVRIAIANINEQITLIDQTIKSRESSLEIINKRYELGLETVSALDVRLARENLASAQSQRPVLESQLKEQIYALNILMGEMPNQTATNAISDFAILPPPARLQLPPPVALLDLRPDLRADEYRLAAAKYDVNVAMANLYPSISISGGYGFASNELSNLISAEKMAWNLLANLTQPIFEGGRLRANVRLQESRARELANQYSQNILLAVQEVENALQSEESLRNQLKSLEKTNNEAAAAYDLAKSRYERGLLTITNLFDIERRILTQKQQILTVQQAIWQSRIALHLALGGQWVDQSALTQADVPSNNKAINQINSVLKIPTAKTVQKEIGTK